MVLKNGIVLNEKFNFIDADVIIEDGKIKEITSENDFLYIDDSIDCSNCYILPGFIDTHIHGAYGSCFNDANVDINTITAFEAAQGVTCIAATTASSEYTNLLKQFDNIVEAIEKGTKGAKIGGIHAEGPFLNKTLKGAMNPEYIITPTIEKVDQMLSHCKGYLKLITIAPEIDNAQEAIEYAVENGVKVSLGHTNATYAEAEDSISKGATQGTHTFNAMRPYNHREPGVLGALLTNPKVKCEMICDFVHLHPKTIELIYRLKGAENINMVSDSGHAAGTELSEFMVGEFMCYVNDGVVHLADGTIAGSTKTLLDGVKNLVSIGIPLAGVSKMASYNPAKTLGIENEIGSIAVGKCADLVVLDKDLNIMYTFVDGIHII